MEKLRRKALEMGREKESLHTVLDMLVQPEQLEALGLSSLERYGTYAPAREHRAGIFQPLHFSPPTLIRASASYCLHLTAVD